MPEIEEKSTCIIDNPDTVFIERSPTPRIGGMVSISGIRTTAPPRPSNPDIKPPSMLTTNKVRNKLLPPQLKTGTVQYNLKSLLNQ